MSERDDIGPEGTTDDAHEPADDPAAALYRRWHAVREPERTLPAARQRLLRTLEREVRDDERGAPDASASPELLYRRWREERVATPAATIDAIVAAVRADAAAQRVPDASREESAVRLEASPAESSNHTPSEASSARSAGDRRPLAELFGLPGRLLDRTLQAIGGALRPAPLRRALPALALAAVALAVAPLLLLQRDAGPDGSSVGGTQVAAFPDVLLDQANSLAVGIETAGATGLGFASGERVTVAFNVGVTVTDLVVLANAERSPTVERLLERVAARLLTLAEAFGDPSVVSAASAFEAGASLPADTGRAALERASERLRDALAREAGADARYDLGRALGFVGLAASLDSDASRALALPAAFEVLARIDRTALAATLPANAGDEIEALEALVTGTDAANSAEILRRVSRLQLLLG